MEIIITYMTVALVISAICSVCEASLSSTPMTYVSTLTGKKGADVLRNFKENMDKPLSAILIVNTVANTVGASLVGSAAASYAVEQGYPESTIIGIISALFTVLVLMFAEILPKTIGANYWKSIILTVVKIIQFMIWLTYPFVFLLGFVTRFLSNDNATTVSREEITAVSTEGLKGGVINEQENTIIQRILSMKEHTLEEILVPASVVESVKEEDTISKTTIKHSRIPVIGEKGFCIGFLLKDEMKECANKVAELKHPIASYIDDTTIWDAFMNMAEKHEQITAVIDQYGQFRGIVSFEDILESILGIEIIDENDKEVDHQSLAKAIYRKTMQGK